MDYRRLSVADAELLRAAAACFKERDAGLEHARSWLANDRNLVVVAHEGGTPIGWVYGYELPRVDSEMSMMLLYEIDVVESRRRTGIGTELLRRFRELAAMPVWLLTNESSAAAMALYESVGGERPHADDAMFRFKSV